MNEQHVICNKVDNCAFPLCSHHSPHRPRHNCIHDRCDMRKGGATCVPMMRKSAFLTELTGLLNAGYAVHFAPLPVGGGDIIVVVSRGDDEIARQVGHPAIVGDLLSNAYMQVPEVRDEH